MNHVPVGTYYVVAVLPGYQNLLGILSKKHFDEITVDERKSILAGLPMITVASNQPAQASVRLERGAEIDGTATYDDGSPAIGLRISYELKSSRPYEGVGIARMMQSQNNWEGQPITDDRGHFRIMGVPLGTYVISTVIPTLSAENPTSQLMQMLESNTGGIQIYAGGSLRVRNADQIKVDAGGASKEVNLTIPLSKLHTVRGQVTVKSTGQSPPDASVKLLYADTREIFRITIAPDGVFELHFVPEGKFILQVSAMSEPPPKFGDDDEGAVRPPPGGYFFSLTPKGRTAESSAEIPIDVTGDIDHLVLVVPDPPTSKLDKSGAIDQGDTPRGTPDIPQ
jgi:hypothetical protein